MATAGSSEQISNVRSIFDAAAIALSAVSNERDAAELLRTWEAYRRRYQVWYLSLTSEQRREAANYSNGDPTVRDVLLPFVGKVAPLAGKGIDSLGYAKTLHDGGLAALAGELVVDASLAAMGLAGVILSLSKPSRVPSGVQEIFLLDRFVNEAFSRKMVELVPLPTGSAISAMQSRDWHQRPKAELRMRLP